MTRFALAALLVAACGGDDGGGGGGIPDAPQQPDASTDKVVTVTCPPTPDAMVTVNVAGTSYSPAAQPVAVNAVVKFVMTAGHDVKPNPLAPSDPGLAVDFGETKCLQFTAIGELAFYCTAHSFAGSIFVQ